MMAPCGGLISGVNRVTPNIPRLVMVKVASAKSATVSRLAAARDASSFNATPVSSTESVSAMRMTGTTKPYGVSMATDILTCSGWIAASSSKRLFMRGCRPSAFAVSQISRAVTLTRWPSSAISALIRARRAASWSASSSQLTENWGISRALCSIRLAIVFCAMPKGIRSGPGFPTGAVPSS